MKVELYGKINFTLKGDDMKNITLNNGVQIPIIGLGTFRGQGNDIYNAVLTALRNGYRHIDTAQAYGNEIEVGKAIKDSGVPREEIFITTKLWNDFQGKKTTVEAIERSLRNLGVDYIDLFLIHWHKGFEIAAESWEIMENYYKSGKIRALGVSNFTMFHIDKLLETCEIKPVINQVETHIGLPQHCLQRYCASKGIYLTAYAPMQVGQIFNNKTLDYIAKKHKKTIANVALKYLVDRNIIVIPKSVKEEEE